jgi:riboflavin kinase/FMN adenylyltransferase
MDEAAALLGRPYYVDGVVVEGKRRGRELGFPTANLETRTELVPPNGVYATIMTIDGVVHGGVTNIGMRPTFGETAPTVETHVLDYSGNLYGQTVRLAFVQRLRDERRFEDVDALRAQIDADKRRAERLFTRLAV